MYIIRLSVGNSDRLVSNFRIQNGYGVIVQQHEWRNNVEKNALATRQNQANTVIHFISQCSHVDVRIVVIMLCIYCLWDQT